MGDPSGILLVYQPHFPHCRLTKTLGAKYRSTLSYTDVVLAPQLSINIPNLSTHNIACILQRTPDLIELDLLHEVTKEGLDLLLVSNADPGPRAEMSIGEY